MLKKIANINGKRLCELAIIKYLMEIGIKNDNITKSYSFDEHKNIWAETIDIFEQNKNTSEFLVYIKEFLTQFSPNNNSYNLDNVNHITHYLKTGLELLGIINFTENLNIIELGSNNGILSKTLQLFGHNVLCTDLHHGIITNSINPYKAGTWVRENFIGINAVDTFKFKEDNINNLCIFENGIDIIVMRGTGILSIGESNNDCLNPVKNNIMDLLRILNKNGIIFAKNENLFSNFENGKRINLLNTLSENIIDICSIDYKIEKYKYINTGWEKFNITLICRKK